MDPADVWITLWYSKEVKSISHKPWFGWSMFWTRTMMLSSFDAFQFWCHQLMLIGFKAQLLELLCPWWGRGRWMKMAIPSLCSLDLIALIPPPENEGGALEAVPPCMSSPELGSEQPAQPRLTYLTNSSTSPGSYSYTTTSLLDYKLGSPTLWLLQHLHYPPFLTQLDPVSFPGLLRERKVRHKGNSGGLCREPANRRLNLNDQRRCYQCMSTIGGTEITPKRKQLSEHNGMQSECKAQIKSINTETSGSTENHSNWSTLRSVLWTCTSYLDLIAIQR